MSYEPRMRAKPELRTVMAREGRQHKWFADMLGISRSQFSHIVAGRRSLDGFSACRVSAALGFSLYSVFESPEEVNDVDVQSEERAS